jgi:hypothetical protein
VLIFQSNSFLLSGYITWFLWNVRLHSTSYARRWLSSYSLLWDFKNLQFHSYFKLSALICRVYFLWVCILHLLSMQRVNPKIHFSCGVFPQAPWWTWVKFSIRGLCVTLLSLLNFSAHFSTGTCSVYECINEIFHVLFYTELWTVLNKSCTVEFVLVTEGVLAMFAGSVKSVEGSDLNILIHSSSSN